MVDIVSVEDLLKRDTPHFELVREFHEGIHNPAFDNLGIVMLFEAVFFLQDIMRFERNAILSESSFEFLKRDGAAVVTIQLLKDIPELLSGQLLIDLLHESVELREIHFLLSVESKLFDEATQLYIMGVDLVAKFAHESFEFVLKLVLFLDEVSKVSSEDLVP